MLRTSKKLCLASSKLTAETFSISIRYQQVMPYSHKKLRQVVPINIRFNQQLWNHLDLKQASETINLRILSLLIKDRRLKCYFIMVMDKIKTNNKCHAVNKYLLYWFNMWVRIRKIWMQLTKENRVGLPQQFSQTHKQERVIQVDKGNKALKGYVKI